MIYKHHNGDDDNILLFYTLKPEILGRCSSDYRRMHAHTRTHYTHVHSCYNLHYFIIIIIIY